MSAPAEQDYADDLDGFSDETEHGRQAREDTDVLLGVTSQAFVDEVVAKILMVVDELSGHSLHPYQRQFSARIIESLIINDGATITALFARQSGKSETISNTLAACMIMLPCLAPLFPDLLSKFAEGVWVGAFAPVEDQADTLRGPPEYGPRIARSKTRIVPATMTTTTLTSEMSCTRRIARRLRRSSSSVAPGHPLTTMGRIIAPPDPRTPQVLAHGCCVWRARSTTCTWCQRP